MTIQQHPWDKVLIDGHAPLVRARRVFRYLPSAPRCKLCNNPFARPVGRLLAAAGFRPSRKNPNLCSRCCDALPVGRAEVDIAVLFADVRGSTALDQRSVAADFAALLNRFYIAATHPLLRHDAVIDKLIGDEGDGVLCARHQRAELPTPGGSRGDGVARRGRVRQRPGAVD
jgi:adenylate cyclase